MTHTIREKKKLLARVGRIRGQVEAIERALNEEAECERIMHTAAGALLLAALAYSYARKYANDRNFTFGTGKFGDLAGYTSAIVLAMIALLIAYEAVSRLFNPVAISFNEAIPIAVLGLAVNVASAWLLSGGHRHGHGHSHGHDHDHRHG